MIKDFADCLPKELVPTLDEAFLWDIGDLMDEEELFNREWQSAIRSLERSVVKKAIQVVSLKMHHTDSTQEEDTRLRELTDRLKALEKEG